MKEEYEEFYKLMMTLNNLDAFNIDNAIERIGMLTDLSLDLSKEEGLKQALRLSEQLLRKELTSIQRAYLHYFIGNVWANIKRLSCGTVGLLWEEENIEQEIIYYRRASYEESFNELPKQLRCEILTNIGNLFSEVGRFTEAIEFWERALDIIPKFGMALGNKAYCLLHYAKCHYDTGQMAVMLKLAHSDLDKALKLSIDKEAKQVFLDSRLMIEKILDKDFLIKEINIINYDLGSTQEEIIYREWCLKN